MVLVVGAGEAYQGMAQLLEQVVSRPGILFCVTIYTKENGGWSPGSAPVRSGDWNRSEVEAGLRRWQ
jgi:hypothetical protein